MEINWHNHSSLSTSSFLLDNSAFLNENQWKDQLSSYVVLNEKPMRSLKDRLCKMVTVSRLCKKLQAKLQMVPFSKGQIAGYNPLKTGLSPWKHGQSLEYHVSLGHCFHKWLQEKCSLLTTVPRIPCRTFCLYTYKWHSYSASSGRTQGKVSKCITPCDKL